MYLPLSFRLNKRLVLILPIILAFTLFAILPSVPSAHAQLTGLVCITSSTTATSCPASAPSLGPFTVGSTFTVGVFIQGSDAMGGFDIYVASDPAFVSSSSAALGTLIASPSLTSICVNGLATTGSCTANTANENVRRCRSSNDRIALIRTIAEPVRIAIVVLNSGGI